MSFAHDSKFVVNVFLTLAPWKILQHSKRSFKFKCCPGIIFWKKCHTTDTTYTSQQLFQPWARKAQHVKFKKDCLGNFKEPTQLEKHWLRHPLILAILLHNVLFHPWILRIYVLVIGTRLFKFPTQALLTAIKIKAPWGKAWRGR